MKRVLFSLVLCASLACAQTTTTPNLNLNKPVEGSTGWGAVLNGNFDILDSYLSGGSILPWLQVVKVTITGTPTASTDTDTVGARNAAIAAGTCSAANSVPWSGVTSKPSTFAPPTPTTSTLGGVMAKTCSGTDKLSAIGTDGVPVCTGDQTGAGGTGITSLNGSTGSTQTFATPGTSGTAPSWSTNTGTGAHTLNIPLASAGSVTAGLVDNARWVKFNTRQITFLAGADNATSRMCTEPSATPKARY